MNYVQSGALCASRRNNVGEGPPRARSGLALGLDDPTHHPEIVSGHCRSRAPQCVSTARAGCSAVSAWGEGGCPQPTVPALTHPLATRQAAATPPTLSWLTCDRVREQSGGPQWWSWAEPTPTPVPLLREGSPSSRLSLEFLCAAPQPGRGEGSESRKPSTKALWAQKPVHGHLRSRRWLISSNNEQRLCPTP